jgi:hypothetical protein
LEGKIPNRVRAGLLSFLAVSGLFYAATAIHRPLVALPRSVVGPWGSPSILSADRRTLELSGYAKTQEKPLLSVVDTIVKDGCRRVGVSFGYNDMEYLLWRLTAERSPEPVMFKSVNVRNSSEKLPPEFPSEELCGVVESEGGAMIYFDAADMKKLHAAGNHEPPRISEIRNK